MDRTANQLPVHPHSHTDQRPIRHRTDQTHPHCLCTNDIATSGTGALSGFHIQAQQSGNQSDLGSCHGDTDGTHRSGQKQSETQTVFLAGISFHTHHHHRC